MATLKDVAQASGVSLATASRVLNNGKGISEKTTMRVLQVAKELHYIPNLAGKILAGKRSKMIGMIVPEIDSNFFAKMIFEVEHQLQKQGYFLLIANTQYKKEKEIQALNTFCTYNVDGVFLTCTINNDILDVFSVTLKEQNIPLILLEARLHTDSYSYIMVDDEAGMIDAIRCLKEKGHQRVGFISDYILDILRADQFISALKKNGMNPEDNPIYTNNVDRFEQSGYDTMKRILKDPNRPSAFLAGYDNLAIGAIRAIEEAGLSVPEDIAIIGNDNIRESSYLHKPLTTLSPPVDKMAKLGAEIMVKAIEGENDGVIHHILLKPDLIIRKTT